jgi:hypothetical protein
VDSTDLTQAQADALRRQVARHLTYLSKLRDRMDALSFPMNDLLYVATAKGGGGVRAAPPAGGHPRRNVPAAGWEAEAGIRPCLQQGAEHQRAHTPGRGRAVARRSSSLSFAELSANVEFFY